MNYNNSALRLRNTSDPRPTEQETVFSLETDKRGTHLRVRKVTTVLRRAMRPVAIATLSLTAAMCLPVEANAQFNISTSPGLFTPGFRDTTSPFDDINTTFFGWASGTFDGGVDNELMQNPAPTLGVGGLDGALDQVGTDDILSGSNNVYTGGFPSATLSLQIPTNGTVGSGFTTIILQGRTIFGGYAIDEPFAFPALGGDTPDVVVGLNSAGQGQFWAKYEITGNAASYNLNFDLLGTAVSVAQLTVDTQWSGSGFSPDTAQAVPEPSTLLAAAAGMGMLGMIRRRRTESIA